MAYPQHFQLPSLEGCLIIYGPTFNSCHFLFLTNLLFLSFLGLRPHVVLPEMRYSKVHLEEINKFDYSYLTSFSVM